MTMNVPVLIETRTTSLFLSALILQSSREAERGKERER